jgi:hypothetical protein
MDELINPLYIGKWGGASENMASLPLGTVLPWYGSNRLPTYHLSLGQASMQNSTTSNFSQGAK